MNLRNTQKRRHKPQAISVAVSVNMVLLLTNYPTCLLYTKHDINILYTKEL